MLYAILLAMPTNGSLPTGPVVDRFVTALFEDGLAKAQALAEEAEVPSQWHAQVEGLSQRGLAEIAELSRPSVSAVQQQLKKAKLLRAPASPRGARGGGPKRGILTLDPRAGVAIGVEIGHQHVRVAAGDLYGQLYEQDDGVRERRMATSDGSAYESLAYTGDQIEGLLTELDVRRDYVVGIGIGLAGPISEITHKVRSEHIMGGDWKDVSPVTVLHERFRGFRDDDFLLDNDANLSAMAEHTWGAARNMDHVVYVKWAEGIGFGQIVNGELNRGVGGAAGEGGHTIVDPTGDYCERCTKHGCLETVAARDVLLGHDPADPIAIDRFVEQASKKGSDEADRLKRAAHHLGEVLAPLINFLNPEAVILGGAIGTRVHHLVAQELLNTLRERTMGPALTDVTMLRGELAGRTTVRGAIAQVLHHHLPRYIRKRAGLNAK